MTPNSLKQMVFCGFIDKIIITSFPEYFTISFLTASGANKEHAQYLSYDDRKGKMRHFRSAKSLHSKISEILEWPVNQPSLYSHDRFSIQFNFIPCSSSLEHSSNETE